MLPWKKIYTSLLFLLLFLGIQFSLLSDQTYADLQGNVCTGDVSYANESTPITGSVTITGDSSSGNVTKSYPIDPHNIITNNVTTTKNQFSFVFGNPFQPPSQAGTTTIKSISFAIKDNAGDEIPTKVLVNGQYTDTINFSLSEQENSNDTTVGYHYVCDKLQNLTVQKVATPTDQWGCFFADGRSLTGGVYKIAPDNDPKTPWATYSTQAAAQADCGTYVPINTGGNHWVCSPQKDINTPDAKAAGANVFHTLNVSGDPTKGGKQSCNDFLKNNPNPNGNNNGTTPQNRYSISGNQCVSDPTGDYATLDDCNNALPKVPTPTPTPPQPPCNEPEEIINVGTGSGITKFTNCYGVATGLGIDIYTDPTLFVKSIFEILLSVSGGIAIFLIIRSGYQMMTSSGDPERIKNAKEILSSAIIGLLFIIFSLVILEIIGVDILQIPGLNH